MTLRAAPLRALSWLVLAASLGGCSSLPFLSDEEKKAPAAEPPGEADVALYDFDVEAPAPLRKLLLDYLDLSRFQKAPKSERISPSELDRLVGRGTGPGARAARDRGLFRRPGEDRPEQGSRRQDARRAQRRPRPARQGRERRHRRDRAARAARRRRAEDGETDRLERMRRSWPLQTGEPFRQSAWSSAKTAALGELRADGYPKASWQSTHAKIDATAATAALSLTVDGGPLYHLGPIRIEGVHRYDEEAVRRLATFYPGEVYSEKLLLDYQERLVKAGLFEGASVELDVDAGSPDAAPVSVKVKELPQQQATFGVGYSANTGPRLSLDHYDRKVFGWPWIAHSTLIWGPSLKSLGTELTSYPLEGLKRNLLSANVEQLDSADETRYAATARLGRSQDTGDYERVYFGELTHTRVENAQLATTSDAAAVHYHWLRRAVDNPLLPTTGTMLALQGGVGYGTGVESRSDVVDEFHARGPFVRTYARLNAYRPFGAWQLNTRLEAGDVFVRSRISVPDTLLFRAGGDNSVRGYGYRTLGPSVNGAIVGGRVLLTGSVEAEHPLTARLPALLGAVFVDAGDAADRWTELHPVFGYGVGLHYRSPVGLLRLDLAYGQAVHSFRLHLSVGVAF